MREQMPTPLTTVMVHSCPCGLGQSMLSAGSSAREKPAGALTARHLLVITAIVLISVVALVA